jgi:hypothetical protein
MRAPSSTSRHAAGPSPCRRRVGAVAGRLPVHGVGRGADGVDVVEAIIGGRLEAEDVVVDDFLPRLDARALVPLVPRLDHDKT